VPNNSFNRQEVFEATCCYLSARLQVSGKNIIISLSLFVRTALNVDLGLVKRNAVDHELVVSIVLRVINFLKFDDG
jgi:hypothetical protein